MPYIRDVLLFWCSRVHERGADAIGRYDIYVKTVLSIWFEGFTNIPTFVGYFPSHSYCLDIFLEVYTGIETERFGIGVLPWQR